MKKFIPISQNIVNRMPRYLRCLHNMKHCGLERTSSSQIAQILGTTPSQVRQDLSAFGSFGAQGYGYNIKTLILEIERILGLDRNHNIAVIGIGGMGRALLEHMEFEEYNYHVCAAFDISPDLIGNYINGIKIQHIRELSEVADKEKIDICLLTVPKQSANEAAAIIKKAGIPAVWNFTNEDLGLDGLAVVQNVNLLDSLFALTFYLETQCPHLKKHQLIAM